MDNRCYNSCKRGRTFKINQYWPGRNQDRSAFGITARSRAKNQEPRTKKQETRNKIKLIPFFILTNLNLKTIISALPYSPPFLFVDELTSVDENGASGVFRFSEDLFFFQGHFKNNPVTPGVILTECMAQIGVVCLGIFLLKKDPENKDRKKIALSSTEMEFYLPVFPGEKVTVISKKIYFRFNKLKCDIQMFNADERLVCKGKIAGMIG